MNSHRKRHLAILLCLLAVGLPAQALASGFILPSSGAKASSMAGAWIAQGDDLSVMDHNPSQLARQREIGIEAHYTGYLFDASFTPSGADGMPSSPVAKNTGDFLNHIPNLYAVFPIGERFVLGAGLFTPVGPRHTYGDSGAQRYQMQQAIIALAWGTVAGVYRVADDVAVSLSLDVGYVNATQKFALGLIPGYRTFDGSLILEGSGVQRPRPKLGVLWDVTDEWHLGVVAAAGMDYFIEGVIRADVPQVGFDPERDFDNIRASQRIPTDLRIGLGWTSHPFRAELAGRYYRWSEYKQQTVELENNRIGAFHIDDLTVPKYYSDSFAIQLGGGWRFLPEHEVRAGYTFDSQATQDKGLTIQDFDAPKHIIGLGYGWDIGERWNVNGAWNRVFYLERVVDDSEHTPIAVLGEPQQLGNGTYHWNVNTFALSVATRF